jgi:hypothetical protein
MRILQQLPGVLYALTMCCCVGAGLLPLSAVAGGSSTEYATVAEGDPALRLQMGPCGLRSLRGQGGHGADLVGVWHCAQQVLLPARFRDSDNDTDSKNPVFTKKDGLKWGVRVRHDRVLVSVGLKW